eukprot:jgi/Picsp_1/875/NSC_04363-R1_catalytic coenzyme binding protein
MESACNGQGGSCHVTLKKRGTAAGSRVPVLCHQIGMKKALHTRTRPPKAMRRTSKNVVRGVVRAAANGEEEEPTNKNILESIFQNSPFGQKTGTVRLRAGKANEGSLKPGLFGTLGFGRLEQGKGGAKKRDEKTVLVVGSTGRLGLRCVHQLANAGFNVRAGVRSQEKADEFDDRLDELCESVGGLDPRARSRITVVYCDLQDADSIKPAIGNASRVVCAVGAAESEFTNLAAPKKIDYEATETLIQIAAQCKIPQFVLVTSLGTGKLGFPAGVLNLFGGILIWKRKAEEALERSGMPYLIVRPGGMERPKDDHKLTHNVRLSTRHMLFGGTVSRFQVAELIASALLSPETVSNKCIEVVAETEAPALEYVDLLQRMPVEIEQEVREENLEKLDNLESEKMEIVDELVSLTEELEATRETIASLQIAAKEARASAKEAIKENAPVIREAESFENEVESLAALVSRKSLEASAAKAVATAAQKGIQSGTILTSGEIAAIKQSILNPPEEEEEDVEEEKSMAMPIPFFAGFGTVKKSVSNVAEEEVLAVSEPADDKSEEAIEKEGTSIFAGFSGFLSGAARSVSPSTGEEAEEEEQVATRVAIQEARKEEVEEEKSDNISLKLPQNLFSSFSNLFGAQEAVYIDELEKDDGPPAEEQAQEVPKASDEASAPVMSTQRVDAEPVEDIPANVKEAREWIAAWKARSN